MDKLKYPAYVLAGFAIAYLFVSFVAWSFMYPGDWGPGDRFAFLLFGFVFALGAAFVWEEILT